MGPQIDSIRKVMGEKLLILGHHYQRSSVLQHADETGDSLELARKVAAHPEAEKIVFCGVNFMAESADILSGQNQTVYMPDTSAGCPMANMADAKSMKDAWQIIQSQGNDWLPVVYVNSTAEIKALCGEWGGATCTSSNAAKVFEWVFAQNKRVFFLPDEHLGANTANDLGIPDSAVAIYDPAKDNGGLTPDNIKNSRVIVWKGFCLVHTAFKTAHVKEARKQLPDAMIIVHPEAPKDVVRECDAHGSTSQIIKYVDSALAGSTIVIGTEVNLVERMAVKSRGRVTVKALSPSICANMSRTNQANLLKLLTSFPTRNEIHVPEAIAEKARLALSRMLEM